MWTFCFTLKLMNKRIIELLLRIAMNLSFPQFPFIPNQKSLFSCSHDNDNFGNIYEVKQNAQCVTQHSCVCINFFFCHYFWHLNLATRGEFSLI